MANLIPFGKSSSSIIKPSKLLSSSLVKRDNTAIVAKPNSDGKILFTIKNKVIKIDKLLKSSLLTTKKDTEKKRTLTEQEKFKNREKELEKQKPKEIKGINIPTPPRLGVFDWIKNFVFNTFLGFIAVRLIDHLPTLIKLTPIIFSAGEFIIDVGGKLLNGLVTFVDKAYDVVDKSREFAKTLGGNGALQNFDKFNGALSKMLDIAVIAAISAATMGDDFGGPGGPGATDFLKVGGKRGVNPQVVRRFIQRYGIDAARQKFGQEGIKSLGGKFARSGLTNLARRGLIGTLGKGGVKGVLRLAKPLLARIPLIGGLLEFGLSWALGDPIGRAAFKGVGALLVGAVGTAIGGPIGSAIGGFVGGEVGGKLYDMFFKNKKPNQKTVKAAGGGRPATRGGKLVSGPAKRTVKKKKTPRTVKATPPRLRPGGAVGGEKNIQKIFPKSDKKDQMNSFEFLKKTYETFSKSTGLGSLVALAMKPVLGDRPTAADYKNAGVGINNWMNRSIASGTLAYAGGGEVRMESIVSGEDYSDVIARSVKDSVSSEVDKAIQDLMRQLKLKQQIQGPDKTDPTLQKDEEIPTDGTGGQWGPLLDLIAGKESGGNYEAMYPSTTLKGATKMTIAEVARRATGAVGKYQQLPRYLVGRAKAAGLNPDKDLYSPENQDLIITKVNIKGRGGERWLRGEISDEQFMQGLSQEFASLPNANGQFYYRGQRSSMTPSKVKATLAQVKKGGYSTGIAGSFPSGGTGAGYGSGGVKIAGDLGDFMKANRGKIGVTGEIHQHPRHPRQFRRGYFSYHNQNRALDIGGWGPAHPSSGGRDEQAPVIRALLAWNKKYGYKPVEIIHGSPAFRGLGKYESAPNALHSNHVHVAYAKGGRVKKRTFAMLGENGPEFVFDADTTAVLDKLAPGMLEKLNIAETKSQVNSILQSYMSYEAPYGGEPQVVYMPVEVPVEVFVPVGGGMAISSGGGGIDSTYDTLEII